MYGKKIKFCCTSTWSANSEKFLTDRNLAALIKKIITVIYNDTEFVILVTVSDQGQTNQAAIHILGDDCCQYEIDTIWNIWSTSYVKKFTEQFY